MIEDNADKPAQINADAGEIGSKIEWEKGDVSKSRGNAQLVFLIVIILEAFLILFFSGSYVTTKKKTVGLKIEIKKLQDEFAQKEQDLSSKLEGFRASENEIKEKLKELEVSKSQIEAKLKDSAGLEKELRAQLETAKKEKGEDYKKVMADMRKTQLALLAKLEMAYKENSSLQNKLFKLTVLSSGTGALLNPGPGIDLQKIIIKPQEQNLIEGKIVKIDPKYGFIIFDLGEDNGVKQGWTADIYRGNMKIAEAAVNEVYTSMSFAMVIKEKAIRQVAKGDRVVFKLSSP